jgi:hypothetical protein
MRFTHGRGIWVVDVSSGSGLTSRLLRLMAIRRSVQRKFEPDSLPVTVYGSKNLTPFPVPSCRLRARDSVTEHSRSDNRAGTIRSREPFSRVGRSQGPFAPRYSRFGLAKLGTGPQLHEDIVERDSTSMTICSSSYDVLRSSESVASSNAIAPRPTAFDRYVEMIGRTIECFEGARSRNRREDDDVG